MSCHPRVQLFGKERAWGELSWRKIDTLVHFSHEGVKHLDYKLITQGVKNKLLVKSQQSAKRNSIWCCLCAGGLTIGLHASDDFPLACTAAPIDEAVIAAGVERFSLVGRDKAATTACTHHQDEADAARRRRCDRWRWWRRQGVTTGGH